MAAYPIITPDSPAVEITTNSSSLTYPMLLNTLTFTTYQVKQMYILASSFNQATVQFQYINVKSNGQSSSHNFSQDADLYQYLPVFDVDVSDEELVLDNMSVIALHLDPGASIKMNFWSDSVSFNNILDEPLNDYEQQEIQFIPLQKRHSNKHIKTILAISALSALAIYFLIKEKE